MKKCTKCNTVKKLNEFYNSKSTKNGLTHACKKCMTAYRHKNKEKQKLYMQNLRETNNEKVKETRNKSYRNNDPRKKCLQQIKHRAFTRNIEFKITIDDLKVPSVCPYLKVPFIVGTKGNYEYTHSVDRVDNSKGYIPGNVEIVSKKANSMKNNASTEELIQFAVEIINRNINNDIVRAMLKDIEVEDKEPLR